LGDCLRLVITKIIDELTFQAGVMLLRVIHPWIKIAEIKPKFDNLLGPKVHLCCNTLHVPLNQTNFSSIQRNIVFDIPHISK